MGSDGSPSLAADRLSALRNALLGLHKTLLDSERLVYERDIAPIPSPQHFLNLVLHDPWFAYLHELSEFVVILDELLDEKEKTSNEQVSQLAARARMLLTPSETGKGFEKRYFEALQRDPSVVIAHGGVSKLITSLRLSDTPSQL